VGPAGASQSLRQQRRPGWARQRQEFLPPVLRSVQGRSALVSAPAQRGPTPRQRAERGAFRVEARPVSWSASMRSLAHRLSLPEARRSQPRASLPARAARSASGRAS